jgi:hypothetical protein
MTEINGSRRSPLGGNSIIQAKTSGGILMGWLGASFFLTEMNIITSHLWWPVFAAGVGVLLIVRGIMIYEKTKYWSNDKGAFLGGAFFILLSLVSFVNFGALAAYWPILVVVLGISIVRR